MTGQILIGVGGLAVIMVPVAAGVVIMRRFQRSVRQLISDITVLFPGARPSAPE